MPRNFQQNWVHYARLRERAVHKPHGVTEPAIVATETGTKEMPSLTRKTWIALAGLVLASTFGTAAFAAGSVSMQVEHLVKQAMAEYNTAMEDGDSAAFIKYFASNAKYESPLFRYSGRNELAKQIEAEFKTYKARFQVTKMFVQESSAAIVMTWEGVDRKSGDETKIDMVGLFEVGSSGQFSSAVFYYDSAKAKALANLVK